MKITTKVGANRRGWTFTTWRIKV